MSDGLNVYVLLLEKMRDELMESATPGQELVGSTFRLLALDLDTHLLQALYDVTTLDEVLRAPVHIHVVDLLVELIGIGEHTMISRLQVKAKDSTAEGTQPGELIHVVEHDVEGLVSTPGEAGHSAVVAVGLRAEVCIDIRNEVVQEDGIERSTIVAHALTTTHRGLDVTALHHHDHRHSLALGNGIVHDVLHLTLQGPAGLAFAHTMLQVEHGIALLQALLLIVLSGGIDHRMTPLVLLVTPIVDAADRACGYTLLRTVIVALGSLGNLKTSS